MEEFKQLRVGDVVMGKVVRVTDNEVLVDVGYSFEGTIYKDHLTNQKITKCGDFCKEGDDIEVKVTRLEEGDRTSSLLLSRLDVEKSAVLKQHREELAVDRTVTARAKKRVTGGVLLDFHGVELFMPDSLVDLQPIDAATLVNQLLSVKIIDIREEKGKTKYIASRKQAQYEEQKIVRQAEYAAKKAKEQAEMAEIAVGQVISGKVIKILDFGAVIQIGQFTEGLAHISELSHFHIKTVDEVLKQGDVVQAKIIKITDKKISLSLKALQERPWDLFVKNHTVGEKITGTVFKKMQFGMLIEVEHEVRGLLNHFDYSWDPQSKFAGSIEVGQPVEVQIISIDTEKEQFAVSRKHVEYNPWSDLKLKVGETTSGTIKAIQERGALVEVAGVEAFLPISEISEDRIEKIETVLKVGDVVQVEILKMFPKEWKMTVSVKSIVQRNSRIEYEAISKQNVSSSQSLADLFQKFKK